MNFPICMMPPGAFRRMEVTAGIFVKVGPAAAFFWTKQAMAHKSRRSRRRGFLSWAGKQGDTQRRSRRRAFFRKGIQIESLEDRRLLSAEPLSALNLLQDDTGREFVADRVLVALRTPTVYEQSSADLRGVLDAVGLARRTGRNGEPLSIRIQLPPYFGRIPYGRTISAHTGPKCSSSHRLPLPSWFR